MPQQSSARKLGVVHPWREVLRNAGQPAALATVQQCMRRTRGIANRAPRARIFRRADKITREAELRDCVPRHGDGRGEGSI